MRNAVPWLPVLLLSALPALGQPYVVGVWTDPALARWSTAPVASVPDLLAGAGRSVSAVSTSDLLDTPALAARRLDCLVLPYRAFPAAAHEALARFVAARGSLVLLEGDPFANLLFAAGEQWLPLDEFGAVVRPLSGAVTWDLTHREALPGLTVTGQGTAAAPYVFTTPAAGSFQYGGLELRDLPPAAAGLAFMVRGDAKTAALCLEARERDGSRWKQMVTVTPQWREVRLHLASFCSYASPGRGQQGDYLHPEALRTLYFGLLKSEVGDGAHRFEIRDLRLMATAVAPAVAVAAGVPLPGRSAVEKALGTAVAAGPPSPWPSLFAPVEPVACTGLRPVSGSVLTAGLAPLALHGTACALQPPVLRQDRRLFPDAEGTVRFRPLLEAQTATGQVIPVGGLAAYTAGPRAGAMHFALGLEGCDLTAAVAQPLRALLGRILDTMQTGLVAQESGPRFEATAEGAQAVFALPLTRTSHAVTDASLTASLRSGQSAPRTATAAIPAGTSAATAVEWLRLPLANLDWRQFDTTTELRVGGQVLDRVTWRVAARQALRDLCDFFVQAAQADGKLSHVYFIDSRGARTLLAGFEVFGDPRYRDAALRWARVMIAEQRPDGGYRMGYGITSRGEECYVADGGEIALGMARVAAYADPKARAAILESLRAYMSYRDSFRVEGGGIGVGWCLSDYGKRPIVPLPTPTRVLAPELNTYTITCTLGAAWAYETFRDDPALRSAAVADWAWLMPRCAALSGAAAESGLLAHLLAPTPALREEYAAYLRSAFIEKLGPKENPWWISGGGRASLDLFAASYCYANLGQDPRLLVQMARATSAMTARQSPYSIYRLLGRADLNHDEWLYLCFGGLGLAEMVEPGVTLRRLRP